MDSTASEHMDQAVVTQCDIGERIIVRERCQDSLTAGKVPRAGRCGCSSGNEWIGMFFITIIDFYLKTISHQIAGIIAAHMTEANDTDPLNRRLHRLLPKARDCADYCLQSYTTTGICTGEIELGKRHSKTLHSCH